MRNTDQLVTRSSRLLLRLSRRWQSQIHCERLASPLPTPTNLLAQWTPEGWPRRDQVTKGMGVHCPQAQESLLNLQEDTRV